MDAYGSGDGKTKGAFRVWTNHIPSKSEKYAKTETGKLNQVSNANIFILGRAACVELALAYGERGGLQVWVPNCWQHPFCLHRRAFCAAAYLFLNIESFI